MLEEGLKMHRGSKICPRGCLRKKTNVVLNIKKIRFTMFLPLLEVMTCQISALLGLLS